MKVEGRSGTSRRSYHPSSYSSPDGDEARSNNNAGRGPRRRRAGVKQEAPHQGSRKAAPAPKGTIEKHRSDTKSAQRKRRKRETKEELAALYGQFYQRIPKDATPQQMAQEFADKELRVILSQNGVLINDYDSNGGRGKYTEKTKVQKIEAILSMVKKGSLIPPTRLGEVQPRQKLSRTEKAGTRSHVPAVRSHTAFRQVVNQKLHAEDGRIDGDSSSVDGDDEPAPTTPATDVGAEDVTETETDVLALLSTLASSGCRASADSANCSSAERPMVWASTNGRGGV